MNTKGNQKYIDTRKKIKGVFLKLLNQKEPEKITVSEICSYANIHRTTFYGHYEDINALMQELIKEMYVQVVGFFTLEDELSEGDGFLKLFEIVKSQRAFFQFYFKHNHSVIQTEIFLPQLLKEKKNSLLQTMGFESETELLYHQTFFCAGLVSVMNRWISTGCKESCEEMCRVIAKEYSPNKSILKEANQRDNG